MSNPHPPPAAAKKGKRKSMPASAAAASTSASSLQPPPQPVAAATAVSDRYRPTIAGRLGGGRLKKARAIFDPSEENFPRRRRTMVAEGGSGGAAEAGTSPPETQRSPSSSPQTSPIANRRKTVVVVVAAAAVLDAQESAERRNWVAPATVAAQHVEATVAAIEEHEADVNCVLCDHRVEAEESATKWAKCVECGGRRVHAVCLEAANEHWEATELGGWRCEQCRRCAICRGPGAEDTIYTCYQCKCHLHAKCNLAAHPAAHPVRVHHTNRIRCSRCAKLTDKPAQPDQPHLPRRSKSQLGKKAAAGVNQSVATPSPLLKRPKSAVTTKPVGLVPAPLKRKSEAAAAAAVGGPSSPPKVAKKADALCQPDAKPSGQPVRPPVSQQPVAVGAKQPKPKSAQPSAVSKPAPRGDEQPQPVRFLLMANSMQANRKPDGTVPNSGLLRKVAGKSDATRQPEQPRTIDDTTDGSCPQPAQRIVAIAVPASATLLKLAKKPGQNLPTHKTLPKKPPAGAPHPAGTSGKQPHSQLQPSKSTKPQPNVAAHCEAPAEDARQQQKPANAAQKLRASDEQQPRPQPDVAANVEAPERDEQQHDSSSADVQPKEQPRQPKQADPQRPSSGQPQPQPKLPKSAPSQQKPKKRPTTNTAGHQRRTPNTGFAGFSKTEAQRPVAEIAQIIAIKQEPVDESEPMELEAQPEDVAMATIPPPVAKSESGETKPKSETKPVKVEAERDHHIGHSDAQSAAASSRPLRSAVQPQPQPMGIRPFFEPHPSGNGDYVVSSEPVPDASQWSAQQVAAYFAQYFSAADARVWLDEQVDGLALLLMGRPDVLAMPRPTGCTLTMYMHVVRLQTRRNDMYLGPKRCVRLSEAQRERLWAKLMAPMVVDEWDEGEEEEVGVGEWEDMEGEESDGGVEAELPEREYLDLLGGNGFPVARRLFEEV